MLTELISESCIRAQQQVESWQAAVRAAGNLLLDAGCVENRYVDRMVESVVENGPYIVIEPGIALAHARPEEGAKKVGLSILTLASPVEFGCEENDPVRLVLGLSAVDKDSHLNLCMDIAGLIDDCDKMERLYSCKTATEIAALFRCAQTGKA